MKKNPRVRSRRAKNILSTIAPMYSKKFQKRNKDEDWVLLEGPLDRQFILVAVVNGKIAFRELIEDMHRFKDLIPSDVYASVKSYAKGKS